MNASTSEAEKTPFYLKKCDPYKVEGGRGEFYSVWTRLGIPNTAHPQTKENGVLLCYLRHWALASCGLDELSNFGYHNGQWKDPVIVDKFIEFISNPHLFPDNYHGKEFIFLLTSSPGKGEKASLTGHPQVKLLNQWLNRAHGPATLYLYQLSCK